MLEVRLLGNVELSNDGVRLQEFATHKSEALFALLVLRPNLIISREKIVDLFWADMTEGQGRKCLSSDLWRIREVLKSGGLEPDTYLVLRNQGVGFDKRSAHWLDVESFEENLTGLIDTPPDRLTGDDLAVLEQSIELYRGDLLDNVYDDWILVQREVLRAEYFRALETIMLYYKYQLNDPQAIVIGQKLLGLDPLMENVHREIMSCHHRLGNRSAALKQYALCARALKRELNVAPMEETQELYHRLVTEDTAERPASGRHAEVNASPKPIRSSHFLLSASVESAMNDLESANVHLQQILSRLKSNSDQS